MDETEFDEIGTSNDLGCEFLLKNKNTHVSGSEHHPPSTWCSPGRPCYRERTCSHCFRRKEAFIRVQVLEVGRRDAWFKHLIVRLERWLGSPQEGLLEIAKHISRLTAFMRRRETTYLICIT